MKVLLLLIFNHSETYDKMLELQKKYIHSHPNIDAYFTTLNNDQLENILVENDIIYIKGQETYFNILFKTIESIDHLINKVQNKYDFVIRSNISTLINLDNLYNYLTKMPNKNIYTGGTKETLGWDLAECEVTGKQVHKRSDYRGLRYIQGTAMILSGDVVEKIINIKDSIEYDIVDDVKLALVIKEYLPNVYENMENVPFAEISCNYNKNSVFIRNKENPFIKNGNRQPDIVAMDTIINTYLLKPKNTIKNINITDNRCISASNMEIMKSCTIYACNSQSSCHNDTSYLDTMTQQENMSIYVCAHLIHKFVHTYLPKINVSFYLVTGDSEMEIPNKVLNQDEFKKLITSDKLIYWYAKNMTIPDFPKMKYIPAGLDYHIM